MSQKVILSGRPKKKHWKHEVMGQIDQHLLTPKEYQQKFSA